MLWFSFIRGLNFVFLCFKLIIIHYHTQNPHEIKLKQKIKIEPQNVHFNGCLCAFLPFYRTHDKLPYTSFQYYWLQGGCCESGSPVIDMSRSGGAASILRNHRSYECVSKSPIRYDFRAVARTIRCSVDTAKMRVKIGKN